MEKDFSKNLINQLKTQKVKKKPKIFFIIKDILLWLFFLFGIALGAISLGIIIFYLSDVDLSICDSIGFYKIVITLLPVFWIIVTLISTFLVYINFKNTKNGYRFRFSTIMLTDIVISIILGIVIFISGYASYLDEVLHNNLPKYRELFVEDKETRMLGVWQNEDMGLLIGKIIELSENKIILKDNNSKIWDLILLEDSIIKKRVNIEKGEKIKIIGKKISDNSFEVSELRPYVGKGGKLGKSKIN